LSKSQPVTEAASILPEESDMLAGVIADHWSDHALHIYADWLEEKSDPRGPFLRSFIKAFANPSTVLPASEAFSTSWRDLSGITLLHALRQCKLTARRQEIARSARTTLLIETKESSDKKTPIGVTKFGGCPDLPQGVDWPVCEKGSLAFLAQFNLADLSNTQAARRLPKEGMLHFFIFNDEEGGYAGPGLAFPPVTDTDTIRVIHTRDIKKLHRLEAPDDLGEFNQVAPTRRLTFVEALDFPNRWQIDGSKELASLIFKKNGLFRTTNHFFGYPVYYRMEEPAEFRNGFVHLITFQNVDELPFSWGDGADLYFYIREHDLQAGKFDAVAVYTD
jgi:uncharacterized protein (TIGR02996 family)